MNFTGRAYRAHDPRWSFDPTSGTGAAISGGRFNIKGQAALYLSLEPITALAECTQGFAQRMLPLTLCEYDIACEKVADLADTETRQALAIDEKDMACAWLVFQRSGKVAPSQRVARILVTEGFNGALVPSYVPGIHDGAINLVLWNWSDKPPCKVTVYDPDGRLPTK
ncbi:RES family NAD+ phosphorylase [Sphingorhabdus sp.]|uniref:RES family NAD+ phosphorylase n=1 Tax=Sphingorhabdus sp. TaxID=1902408 RepID=UPI0035940155